jgi:hypothetical protein
MGRRQSFRKKGVVSIWVGLRKPDPEAMAGVDILNDLCGTGHYDLDDQEVSAIAGNFPKAPVADILRRLSYSSSFLAAALGAAKGKAIRHAYWALAQYDFAYDPARAQQPVAPDPVFLGAFDWTDDEADLEAIYGKPSS